MDEKKLRTLLTSNKNKIKTKGLNHPIIFNLKSESDKRKLVLLFKKNKQLGIVDNFDSWLKESFIIRNPKFKAEKDFNKNQSYLEFCKQNNIDLKNKIFSGVWVFYPWKNQLVHLIKESLYYEVLTARNKFLITKYEQDKFHKLKIGIAGLSVGQSAALTIATLGGARNMKLADFDVLEGSNLNRIRGSVAEINESKCDIAARQIYEINPYTNLSLYYEGLNDKNVDEFIDSLDIIIDEIDNFHIKALLRAKAKEKKIPLVMAFDTADGVVLDVERYDINSKQEPFFGRVDNKIFESLLKLTPDPIEIPKLVIRTMGKETIPDLFKSSILKVGTELSGVPQLGSTAFLAGSLVAFAIKMIASNSDINGRFYIDFRNLTKTKYTLNLNHREKEFFKKLIS